MVVHFHVIYAIQILIGSSLMWFGEAQVNDESRSPWDFMSDFDEAMKNLNEISAMLKDILASVDEIINPIDSRSREPTPIEAISHQVEAPQICYDRLGIGCFDKHLSEIPAGPPGQTQDIQVNFHLYTESNKNTPQLLDEKDDESINLTSFTAGLKTKVLIHGLGEHCSRDWIMVLKDALLQRENMNIICVNWGSYAQFNDYLRAARNTEVVGYQTARLLEKLVVLKNLSLTHVHLIGFSIGAQVAAFTGLKLNGVERISGLDPAGPIFELLPDNKRLSSSKAKFVDVIHTDGDTEESGSFGLFAPMGHVDFYPDGGKDQMGCHDKFLKEVFRVASVVFGIVMNRSLDVTEETVCSHTRAHTYFIESIKINSSWKGYPCKSYEDFLKGKCFVNATARGNSMGYFADPSEGKGNMYLTTRNSDDYIYSGNSFVITLWYSLLDDGLPKDGSLFSDQMVAKKVKINQGNENDIIDLEINTWFRNGSKLQTFFTVSKQFTLEKITSIDLEVVTRTGILGNVTLMDNTGTTVLFCVEISVTALSIINQITTVVHENCNSDHPGIGNHLVYLYSKIKYQASLLISSVTNKIY